MSKEIRGNQRHLTLDDRVYIEKCLDLAMTFKDIAKYICKDPSTISKEVKKRRILKPRNTYGAHNSCKHRGTCDLRNVCKKMDPCKKRCAECLRCNSSCNNYEEDACEKLNRACFVCNSCEAKTHCRLDKYYYRASCAYTGYRNALVDSREGINLTEYQLEKVDRLVAPLILKRQSIAHIYSTHKEAIPFSSRTLYSHIEKNLLSVKNIDLPRKVKYKPRRKARAVKRDHAWSEGRRYSNFTAFIENNPDANIVEMDTVEGVKGGKVLLTMLFRSSKCMLAFLMVDKTQKSVLEVFNTLEKKLGTVVFKKTFQAILTDNGSEFINPILLETGINESSRTTVYYCDPNASYQKGALEKNHEFIRYIIPKGKSLNNYCQSDIELMVNHINSLARASLNERTPFEIASMLLNKRLIKAANLERIAPDNVLLRSNLLNKE